jgi:CIC family chloride channel protein
LCVIYKSVVKIGLDCWERQDREPWQSGTSRYCGSLPVKAAGAMAGMAFGVIVRHLFGPAAGAPATYGVIAMGAVFAAAAQAPLTSIASVAEMTGNYGLILPVMLAAGIAAGLARRLSYSTIYTEKLLRRGIQAQPRA